MANIIFLIYDLVKQQLHLEAHSCFVLHSCGRELDSYERLNGAPRTWAEKIYILGTKYRCNRHTTTVATSQWVGGQMELY